MLLNYIDETFTISTNNKSNNISSYLDEDMYLIYIYILIIFYLFMIFINNKFKICKKLKVFF